MKDKWQVPTSAWPARHFHQLWQSGKKEPLHIHLYFLKAGIHKVSEVLIQNTHRGLLITSCHVLSATFWPQAVVCSICITQSLSEKASVFYLLIPCSLVSEMKITVRITYPHENLGVVTLAISYLLRHWYLTSFLLHFFKIVYYEICIEKSIRKSCKQSWPPPVFPGTSVNLN